MQYSLSRFNKRVSSIMNKDTTVIQKSFIRIVTGLFIAAILSLQPAIIKSAQAQNATVRDHRSNATVRDHRSKTKVRDHRVKATYLTRGECTQLGGVVKDSGVSICNSGYYCKRVNRDGSIKRVCISKENAATKNAPKSSISRPPRRTNDPRSKAPSRVVAKPLTVEECKGLGGVVRNSTECGVIKTACITTDQHGVIRTACINKASK